MEAEPTRSQRWATVVDQVANTIIHLTGSSVAFLPAFAGVGIWAVTRLRFDYS
jgi:low affinity Fe/Cu permease